MSSEKQFEFHQLFIPSGRSFFANLQANIFSFLSGNNTLDPFIREFGSIYEAVKDRERSILDIIESKDRDTVDLQKEVTRLVEQSLCGKHIRSRGRDFLESIDGRRIAVANSSSGQQELLPLIILLTALPNMLSSNMSSTVSGYTVYIEEPEAHLFPSSQRSVIELIATVFNYCQDNLQFFITTHSPYVLTSINNLLQAGIMYESGSSAVMTQLEQIVPRYKALRTSEVSAYVLETGKCTSIICPETGLIDAKIIDSVSDDLAIEFDRMLDLT
jgi:predicted ATP-binding protein involved in virulence